MSSRTAELQKYGGRNLWRRIYNVITIIWENQEMPTYDILVIDCELVSKIQRNRILCFIIFGVSAPPVTVRCEIG
jgi:hypothetical protein